MRANEIRALSLEAVHKAGKGHIGGVLSCAEIYAVLYSGVLRHQDKFILSKGHAAIGLYATLAMAGRFPMEEMMRLNQEGMLGEEPNRKIPGIEVNAGSLGHGLGLACGMALEEKLKHRDGRIFVLMGDGECWEGSVWEAAMFGAHHKLNIVVIVDRNGLSIGGKTEDICALEPFADKWRAFGWRVTSCLGHDEAMLREALSIDGPRVVIAHTVKGAGVSIYSGKRESHHGTISDADLALAIGELHGNA